jgi:hypothetical protein
VEHVVRMGNVYYIRQFSRETSKEETTWDTDVDSVTILNRILDK